MKICPVHDHTVCALRDAPRVVVRGARVRAADAVRAWPKYGEYLETENQRVGRLVDQYAQQTGTPWEGYSGDGVRLGDVPTAPVRERPQGDRVHTRQERLSAQGWLVDVIA